MNAQSEEMARQVHAARLARVNIQRMRLLAAQRAEKLELQLKQAAQAGLKTEISRGILARDGLRAIANRPANPPAMPPVKVPVNHARAARYAGIAAFGVVLCAATLGMGWVPMQTAAVHAAAAPASVLNAAPGEPLRLALSYSVSLPAKR